MLLSQVIVESAERMGREEIKLAVTIDAMRESKAIMKLRTMEKTATNARW